MSLIVVQSQEDHEQADAVLRGVAEGLSRLFSVPDHPPGVRDLLDSGTQEESAHPGQLAQRSARRGGSNGLPRARSVKTGTGGTPRGAARPSSRARGRRAKAEAQAGQREQS
ncbi:hypothetical protein LOK46_25885 [Methylobacterium sp. NMS14P]|uniref:hypothetical protein n=1 Tax=Methylobacterium sp. NMS14P TaxID=2894310 RepID=UPI002359B61C|nr:hypothetical protein [Methylobacterium sp. NMS14P]WCS24519.1 hypothetical protein LOK46_25885 [Methylobacterium sp. NMS14P]